MGIVGIIPARLHSSRLPKKLLLNETGRSVLEHTWRRASRSKKLDELWIATDSPEIHELVNTFGGKSVLTGEHPSGTDRIAEAVRKLSTRPDIIVNVQGDEPEIDPDHIDLVAEALLNHKHCEMATLASPMTSVEQIESPSCVKVVLAADKNALYFSRAAIPHVRDQSADELPRSDFGASPWLLHVGLYAYRTSFLQALTQMPPSRLEQLEKLEQLRALEAGAKIRVEVVSNHAPGIDTQADYDSFKQRWKQRDESER